MNKTTIIIFLSLFVASGLLAQKPNKAVNVTQELKMQPNFKSLLIYEKDLFKQWGELEKLYKKRDKLIPTILKYSAAYPEGLAIAPEMNTYFGTATLAAKGFRAQLGDLTHDQTVWGYRMEQNKVSFYLSNLAVGLMQKHPDLEKDKKFAKTVDQIILLEKLIDGESRTYNQCAQNYNKCYMTIAAEVPLIPLGIKQKAFLPQVDINIDKEENVLAN